MKLITASSSALAMECGHPWADDVEWEESKSGSWAMRIGSCVHDAMEQYISGADPRIEDLAQRWTLTARQVEVAEAMWRRLREWVDSSWVEGSTPEAKFAISHDLQTAIAIGQGSDRDYSKAAGFMVAATLDGFAVVNGRGFVLELKTGRGFHPHPSRHPQLRTQVLLAARASGVDEVEAVLVQVNETSLEERRHVFDVFDILEIESDLAVWATRGTEPRPGEWCGRCKAKNCPVREAKKERAA